MLIDDAKVRIESWDPNLHNHSRFDCGVERLNNFLKISAKNQQGNNMTRIYVAVEPNKISVLGYSAINVGKVNVEELPEKPRSTPGHGEMPVLFLGQIAVDRKIQGRKIGSLLMVHVFQKAIMISNEAGCYAVLLDVMSDGDSDMYSRRLDWYKKFGFESFQSRKSRMFLPLKQIKITQ